MCMIERVWVAVGAVHGLLTMMTAPTKLANDMIGGISKRRARVLCRKEQNQRERGRETKGGKRKVERDQR